MRLDLLDLEAVGDGDLGDGGGAPPAADPSPDPSLAEPVAAEPATPATAPASAAAIDWDDINLLNQAAERIAALGYTIQPPTPAEPEQLPALDWADPASVEAYIAAREKAFEDRLAERFAPVETFVQSEQTERVESKIAEDISTVKASLDYPDGDDKQIRALADMFAVEAIQQHGNTPAAGQAAIRQAVETLKAHDDQIAAAAVEAYKESLRNPDRSTPLDPAVNGAGRTATEYVSELDVARSWRDRQPV